MSASPAYGARTIKRERRTRAQVEQLDEQIIDVLVDDNPQSVRHVFYRMTDPRLPEPVEKSDRGYRHVQHRIVELRRSGELPYGCITDTSRRGYFTNTYQDASDFLRHPACPFRLEDGSTARLPAMLAVMQDILTDEPVGVHRTALKPDGSGKAVMPDGTSPKKMMGRAKGAVVKLCADDTVTDGLGICEGIEDALTIIGAGWRPVWAALSAGGIAAFPVLPGLECLTIFGDADPTGLAAAQECQARWRAAGRQCPIVLPPHDGTDWNAWRAS